jgi:hypothetical protein
VYKFVADAAAPARLRRWQWWKALASVGIYVRELYGSTKFQDHVNAEAIGNAGAEGVRMTCHREAKGTITWFSADQRLDSENGNRALWNLVHAGFEEWDLATDFGSYIGRRSPKQITDAFGSKAVRDRKTWQGGQW